MNGFGCDILTIHKKLDDAASVWNTEGTSDQVSSTRSVGMNLARPFKAGTMAPDYRRRVATVESSANFRRRNATRVPY
jgi:hypothetical protein